MLDEFYLPEPLALKQQASGNRQGRGDDLEPAIQQTILDLLKEEYGRQYGLYKKFLGFNLAKELARIGLSLANYTQWYWKIDLHNLMHFLQLRLDEHAQYEIRVFGEAMAKIIKDAVPISYQAFEDYQLCAMSFSRPELDILSKNQWPMSKEKVAGAVSVIANKREREEFLEKLKKVNFII